MLTTHLLAGRRYVEAVRFLGFPFECVGLRLQILAFGCVRSSEVSRDAGEGGGDGLPHQLLGGEGGGGVPVEMQEENYTKRCTSK